MRALLLTVLLLAACAPGGTSHAAQPAVETLTVPQTLQICRQARRPTKRFQLIVATRRLAVRGYFLRVGWNGYPVLGESGVLYAAKVRQRRKDEIVPGGLNVGVPSRQVRTPIPPLHWVTVHGTLRCYAPMGEILFADSWR